VSTKAQSAAVKPFLERLAEGVVVGDGAMGTMLYARGVFINRCFDELNLSNGALVKSVHDDYLDAGADMIETNTFGAHRFKLAPHGLESQVVKINREGARIAREAAHGRALVAGSIGPIGKPLQPFGNIAPRRRSPRTRSRCRGWSRAASTCSSWRRCRRWTRPRPRCRRCARSRRCP
jgi:methionine synthase I (cobalamin-dependent)